MHITHHLETAREDQLAFPQVSVNHDVAVLASHRQLAFPNSRLRDIRVLDDATSQRSFSRTCMDIRVICINFAKGS